MSRISNIRRIGLLAVFFASLFACTAFAKPNEQTQRAKTDKAIAEQYCASCHKVPSPAILSKESWPHVINTMRQLLLYPNGQPVISDETIKRITEYYVGHAQEQLPILPYIENNSSPIQFTPSYIGGLSRFPLIINLNATRLGGGLGPGFIVSDGEADRVSFLYNKDGSLVEKELVQVPKPSGTQVIDFDKDGDLDIIVSALGVFPPSETLSGKLLLLSQETPGEFAAHLLLQDVGRIADASAVDIDKDGDLDIVAAVFGGGKVGEIIWVENLGKGRVRKHVIESIVGALNISPADLNGDGLVDFVSLIAQEHELIVAYINQGEGIFDSKILARAPHPMFGSTGMSLVDLDNDSDLDVLFTNGDAHDLQPDPKPFHGVQWLENKGKLEFQYRDIGRLYGAAVARAGDMDNDGDLDVVVSSWNNYWQDPKRQSIVWFENNGKQEFTPHAIANSPRSIVTMELIDLSNDGRLDIVGGLLKIDLVVQQIQGSGIAKKEQESLKDRFVVFVNNAKVKPSKAP